MSIRSGKSPFQLLRIDLESWEGGTPAPADHALSTRAWWLGEAHRLPEQSVLEVNEGSSSRQLTAMIAARQDWGHDPSRARWELHLRAELIPDDPLEAACWSVLARSEAPPLQFPWEWFAVATGAGGGRTRPVALEITCHASQPATLVLHWSLRAAGGHTEAGGSGDGDPERPFAASLHRLHPTSSAAARDRTPPPVVPLLRVGPVREPKGGSPHQGPETHTLPAWQVIRAVALHAPRERPDLTELLVRGPLQDPSTWQLPALRALPTGVYELTLRSLQGPLAQRPVRTRLVVTPLASRAPGPPEVRDRGRVRAALLAGGSTHPDEAVLELFHGLTAFGPSLLAHSGHHPFYTILGGAGASEGDVFLATDFLDRLDGELAAGGNADCRDLAGALSWLAACLGLDVQTVRLKPTTPDTHVFTVAQRRLGAAKLEQVNLTGGFEFHVLNRYRGAEGTQRYLDAALVLPQRAEQAPGLLWSKYCGRVTPAARPEPQRVEVLPYRVLPTWTWRAEPRSYLSEEDAEALQGSHLVAARSIEETNRRLSAIEAALAALLEDQPEGATDTLETFMAILSEPIRPTGTAYVLRWTPYRVRIIASISSFSLLIRQFDRESKEVFLERLDARSARRDPHRWFRPAAVIDYDDSNVLAWIDLVESGEGLTVSLLSASDGVLPKHLSAGVSTITGASLLATLRAGTVREGLRPRDLDIHEQDLIALRRPEPVEPDSARKTRIDSGRGAPWTLALAGPLTVTAGALGAELGAHLRRLQDDQQ